QQLLTGETRLPGFEEEWEVKRLDELTTFHKGKGLPKSALTPYGTEACVHYGELFTQYSESIRETISRTHRMPDEFRSISNDVLMPTSDVTPRGLAKASCVLINDVVLGGDILVIRTDPSVVCGTFLSYVIRQEEDQVLRLVTGTTVFHLYGADMKKFTFKQPKLSEQQAIVAVLSDMDAEIAALEQRRNKTKDIKQAMMQELLTGKTRLVTPVENAHNMEQA
nr:restriction endonuclease subunit S [Chloroflexota bacterium]